MQPCLPVFSTRAALFLAVFLALVPASSHASIDIFSYVRSARHLDEIDPQQVSPSRPLDSYAGCGNLLAVLHPVSRSYQLNDLAVVGGDVFSDLGRGHEETILMDTAVRLYLNPASTGPEEAALVRSRSSVTRFLQRRIRALFPARYERAIFLKNGILVGGQFTLPELRRTRNPLLADFRDTFSALEIVDFELPEHRSLTSSVPPWLRSQLLWLRLAIDPSGSMQRAEVEIAQLLRTLRLEHLELSGFFFDNQTSGEFLAILEAEDFPLRESVRELVLSDISFVDAPMFLRFLRAFPRLRELQLNGVSVRPWGRFHFIQPHSQASAAAAIPAAVAEANLGNFFRELEHLEFGNLHSNTTAPQLNAPVLFPRTPYGNLTHLSFAHSALPRHFLRDLVASVRVRGKPMTFLDLEDGRSSTTDVLSLTEVSFPYDFAKELQYLDLRGRLGKQDPMPWLRRAPPMALRFLRLDGYQGFGDSALHYLIESKKFAHLHALSFAGTAVTAAGLKSMARRKKAGRLTLLDMSAAEPTESEDLIVALLAGGNLKDLTVWNLRNWMLTQNDLAALRRAPFPFLAEIALTSSTEVSQQEILDALAPLRALGVRIRLDD